MKRINIFFAPCWVLLLVATSNAFAELYREIPLESEAAYCDAKKGSVGHLFHLTTPKGDCLIHSFCTSEQNPRHLLRIPTHHKGHYVAVNDERQKIEFEIDAPPDWGFPQLDPAYPYRFVLSNGLSFHPLGTTAYGLLGLKNTQQILSTIDQLHTLGINRIRFLVQGKLIDGEFGAHYDSQWNGHVQPFEVDQSWVNRLFGGQQYTGMNETHWQRIERILNHMAKHRMFGSLIMTIDRGQKFFPAAYSDKEQNYYAYVAARLGAYPNVMFDLGNEHNEYREVPEWSRRTAKHMQQINGAGPLISAHAYEQFLYQQDADLRWVGWQNLQDYGTPLELYSMVLSHREAFPRPIINEEFGYETGNDPTLTAQAIRKKTWALLFAGAYPTYGAKRCGDFVRGTVTAGCSELLLQGAFTHAKHFLERIDIAMLAPIHRISSADPLMLADDDVLLAYDWRTVVQLPYAEVASRFQQGFCVTRFDTIDGRWTELPSPDPSNETLTFRVTDSVLVIRASHCLLDP